MAKQRIVNTKFWDDSYITEQNPTQKLLFLYLLTSPLTNISGVYELPSRRVAFDTGIEAHQVETTLQALERDGKIIRQGSWIAIVNFIRHQSLNPKVKRGIEIEIAKAPPEIVARLKGTLDSLGIVPDSLSYSNLNPNSNPNPNSNAAPKAALSTDLPQDLFKKDRDSLLRKMKVRHRKTYR